jgi:predicted Zn-dependent protease
LAKVGAFEAAELVYWEGIRRFPWNAHLRSQLIQVLRHLPNQLNQALNLALESFRLFPDSGPLNTQFAIALSQSKDAANTSKAIDILSARLQDIKTLQYEASAMASILVEAEKENLLRDQDLTLLVQRLRDKPQLLGSVGYRLINDHRAFKLARRLLA